jgi:hypothetical protein
MWVAGTVVCNGILILLIIVIIIIIVKIFEDCRIKDQQTT